MTNAENTSFRAGFVAVAGRPNVGKSTLINRALGQKVAAVSFRPQTTRRQQFGILTLDAGQIIFIDTPGIHQPLHKLGERMNKEAASAFQDSDLVLVIVDASLPPQPEDQLLAEAVLQTAGKLSRILALNKIDLVDPADRAARIAEFDSLLPGSQQVLISALTGEKVPELVSAILEQLPEHPPFFPEDQVTDLYEREIAADLIREAALIHLRDEVPHSIAIRIDEFTERGERGAYIAATLFVERDSQKGIVIGKNGKMLKQLGQHARHEIEAMSGRKVFLDIRVKVRKNWRNDDNILNLFGFEG